MPTVPIASAQDKQHMDQLRKKTAFAELEI